MSRSNWTDDKILFRLKKNSTDRTYWDNITTLRKRPSKELFTQCFRLCHSKNNNYRQIGVDILAQFGPTPRPFRVPSLNLFFKLLAECKNEDLIVSILFAISTNNDDLSHSRIQKLLKFVDHPSKKVRKGVTHALGFISNVKVYSAYIQLAGDSSKGIRDWATFFLALSDGRSKIISDTLFNNLSDTYENVRYEAMVGLAKRKDERVIPFVDKELKSPNCGSLVFEVIAELGIKKYLPLLRRIFKKATEQVDINKYWLASVKDAIAELNELTSKNAV